MKRNNLLMALAVLFLVLSGCAKPPAQAPVAQVDVSGVHTMVAKTMHAGFSRTPTETPSPPEPAETVSMPAQAASPTPEITPLPEVIRVPTMENVPLLSGYNTFGIRVLEQPAAVVRNGITLAVEQVIVFSDHIELVYTVRDIPQDVLYDPMTDDDTVSCYGPASYPSLVLPDGEIIFPENYLLDGKARGNMGPFASSYLIHIYRSTLPAEVHEMKLVLNCLELAHLERAPRYWEVPFRIVPAN